MSVPVKTLRKRWPIYPKQADFLDSTALFRAFVGGRGTGKSKIGAYDLIAKSKSNRLYLVAAPTYKVLKDATLRSFLEVTTYLQIPVRMYLTDMRASLPNGVEVLFRSADEPDRLRGPNFSGAWLDEASLMAKACYEVVIACLREGGEQGWLTATFTPKGRLHWTYEVFATGRPDTSIVKAGTKENPFLPESFTETLRRQYGSLLSQQELDGDFVEGGGLMFRRDWFGIVEAAPADLQRVRSWDLAATEQKDSNDPDWTAGVLMGKSTDGTFFILDVRRARGTPRAIEQLVRTTAEQDGKATPIIMEQEPGASGVNLIDHYLRYVLQGFNFHGERPTGDKVTRAQPLSAQAEAGNVKLLRAPWNKDFLDEAESFPSDGVHDDQVDAASQASARLTLHLPKKFWVL